MASTQSKKKLLAKSRLYVVIDKQVAGKLPVSNIADRIKHSGVDIIQLRDKSSKKEEVLRDSFLLHKSLADTKIIFIINDYLDIAKAVDSDGVHLGQEDVPIPIARNILGKDKIIGISCHNLKEALRAQSEGADYLGIGPAFTTSTKPQAKKTISASLINKLKQKINIPFFVIGGINQDNINKVVSAGVKRAAICNAILKAKNISREAKFFSGALK